MRSTSLIVLEARAPTNLSTVRLGKRAVASRRSGANALKNTIYFIYIYIREMHTHFYIYIYIYIYVYIHVYKLAQIT